MTPDRKTCFRVGASLFALYLAILYWPTAVRLLGELLGAAFPLLIGCVVAYLVNILMGFYERHWFVKKPKEKLARLRRPCCMLAAFATLTAVVLLVLRLVVPELTLCVQLIFAELPDAVRALAAWLDRGHLVPAEWIESLSSIDLREHLETMLKALTTGVGSVMGTAISAVSSAVSGVVTAVLAVIFAIYLLLGKETLGAQCDRLLRRYLSRPVYDKTRYVLSVMDDSFHRYIVGQCTEAVILGVLCTLGMWVLGLPYATMTGALMAFTALIPVAGAYIGGGIGAFMIMTVSPMEAVVFLLFIVVLQQVEGNLIYPRVVGSSMGLPAIWVLAAVTVGGGMMGILGMLLGVPLAATLYRLLREDIRRGPMRAGL